MEHVVDAVMAVIVLMLMLLFGTGIAGAQTAVTEARSCKDEIIAQLEDSDFHPDVINTCITQAASNGYTISVTLYREEAAKKVYTSAAATAEDSEAAVAAEVSLAYQYKLSFLGNSTTHYVRGFAR